jgi:hypothetical protein
MTERGFYQFDFIGSGPINAYVWATSVFIRRAGVDGIRHKNAATVGGG